MRPAAQMWETLWVALPVFGIIALGFISGVKLPGNFPVALAALLVGTAIAWAGGAMETAKVTDAVESIAVGIPSLNIDLLFDGLKDISPLLATAIPLGIYNFTEAMSNVESAASAGDDYNLRAVLLLWAAGYAAFGAALASVGLIHGAKVEFFADLKIALGYLFFAGVFAAAHLLGAPAREVDETDPVDIEIASVPPAADVMPHEPVPAGPAVRTA